MYHKAKIQNIQNANTFFDFLTAYFARLWTIFSDFSVLFPFPDPLNTFFRLNSFPLFPTLICTCKLGACIKLTFEATW